jgi:AraC family transcriptional regulator of adaptative response / DNA-3-methyladenine glycosylase II
VAGDPGLLAPSDDLEAIVRRLKSLPGIGEWTAQYVALRGLKYPDAFPASDLGILRGLAGPDGRRRTPAEVLARAEAWRPYRAYAAQHLWAA